MATNMVHATYQEIYDISTIAGKLSIVGIHTPTGYTPFNMLRGFFSQYKKFKYNGITKLALQPAAQLPADPLQVSLEAGQSLDPRDLLNPILFHGARGESIGAALNVAYKNTGLSFQTNSTDTVELAWVPQGTSTPDGGVPENLYYSALSDPSFRKFGVQEFIQLGPLVPLVHRVNSNFYFGPNSQNYQGPQITTNGIDSASAVPQIWDGNTGADASSTFVPVQLFTNGTAELGWMPTRTFNTRDDYNEQEATNPREQTAMVPKLYMGILIFPPSYNQKLYYRCVITHSFSFCDFGTYQDPNMVSANKTSTPNPTSYFNHFGVETTATMSLNLSDAEGVLETSGVM